MIVKNLTAFYYIELGYSIPKLKEFLFLRQSYKYGKAGQIKT